MSLTTMNITPEQIRLELANLESMKTFQMLKERERILRESLENAAPRSHRVNSDGPLISTNSYQLVSGNSHQNQLDSRRATVSMTPRSQSNVGFASAPIRPDNSMMRSRSNMSAQSQPMSRSVSQASDPSRVSLNMGAQGFFGGDIYQGETAQLLEGQTRAVPNRLPNVQEDPALDVGQDPFHYLMSEQEYPVSGLMKSYYSPVTQNDFFAYSDGNATSATPSLISADSAAAPDMDPLTRQNSSVGHAFIDALAPPISRTASQGPVDFEVDLAAAAEKAAAMSFRFGMGTSVPEDMSFNSRVNKDTTSTLCLDPQSTEMFRSCSTSSTRSTASNQERRAKEALGRQIQNGSRTLIAPKEGRGGVKTSSGRPSSTSSSISKSSASAKRHNTLAQYQRRKQPKVFCDKCDEYPDGFRGEHELRRHTSSKHAEQVVKWVCRDPASVGIKSDIVAVHPLSKCKACLAIKKYGAYYNAAAHLRRAHFRRRTARGKKRADNRENRKMKQHESSWPPMSDLKHWMVRVQVRKDDGEKTVQEMREDENTMFDAECQDSSQDEISPKIQDHDIDFVTSGNGGAFDYTALDVNAYPGMIQELDPVDTIMDAIDHYDGSPNPATVGSSCSGFGLSPFQKSASSSPYQAAISPMASPNLGGRSFGVFQSTGHF